MNSFRSAPGSTDRARARHVRVNPWVAAIGAAGLVAAVVINTQPLASAAPLAPACGQEATSPVPTFFADDVAQPPVATPDGANHYTLSAHVGSHSFHSSWPAVTTLGYSTATQQVDYLGPTIVTKQGTPIAVTLKNDLPAAGTEIFPAWDYPNLNNEINLHRHGGLQAVESDGIPSLQIAPGAARTYEYPNAQAAATTWYHDHSVFTNSFNVYAGLAAFMPNTDAIEAALRLPTGDFAKYYALQDKSFNSDYSLCYSHTSPEFFGDLPVVNGTIAPKQIVQPRKYTMTFVNGSDSRFFNLSLTPAAGARGKTPEMTVVGSDLGYVRRPVGVRNLLVAPGERYKVVFDFSDSRGSWVLANDAAAPYPGGDDSIATIPQLMRFDVTARLTGVDRSVVPAVIRETNNADLTLGSLANARLRTLQAGEIAPGMPLLGDVNGLYDYFGKAPTETPQLGSSEVWAMRNHSPDTHPIHEHIVEMRLIGRWKVLEWSAQDPFTNSAVPLKVGRFEPAAAYESGPKDTFVSPPDYITAWVGTYTIGGKTFWHCHILSHEDAEMMMMRPLDVGTAPQTQLPVVGSMARLDRLVRQP